MHKLSITINNENWFLSTQWICISSYPTKLPIHYKKLKKNLPEWDGEYCINKRNSIWKIGRIQLHALGPTNISLKWAPCIYGPPGCRLASQKESHGKMQKPVERGKQQEDVFKQEEKAKFLLYGIEKETVSPACFLLLEPAALLLSSIPIIKSDSFSSCLLLLSALPSFFYLYM